MGGDFHASDNVFPEYREIGEARIEEHPNLSFLGPFVYIHWLEGARWFGNDYGLSSAKNLKIFCK